MFVVPNADKEVLKGSALTTIFLTTEFFKSAVIRGVALIKGILFCQP
jgi:hypothetical protein